MRNILIVFAKLNPGIRYVQGMNEILAPLFYVFRNDPDEEFAVSTFNLFLIFHSNLNLSALYVIKYPSRLNSSLFVLFVTRFTVLNLT